MQIGVIGAAECPEDVEILAETVGSEIARRGAILVCGGLGGVMRASARGAKMGGGLTLGILPGAERHAANEFIDVVVPAGLGEARNALVVRASDAIVAIRGGYGTLSEIALALKMRVPVVGLGTWEVSEEIVAVQDPAQAVGEAVRLADHP
jgi:uncharacterized protein (TIGR00725 family)